VGGRHIESHGRHAAKPAGGLFRQDCERQSLRLVMTAALDHNAADDAGGERHEL
jgi:hypothetical protein